MASPKYIENNYDKWLFFITGYNINENFQNYNSIFMNTISKKAHYNICYFDFPAHTEESKSLKNISPLGNFIISRNVYENFLKSKKPKEVVILSASFGAASNILLSKKGEVSKSIMIAPVIKNLFKSTSNKKNYSKFFGNF